MSETLNIAFYCFTPQTDLGTRRREWQERLALRGIKGTVILAPEGVNGFLAGPSDALRHALQDLRSLPEFAAVKWKESLSGFLPFRQLRIKVKPEIVTFRHGPIASQAKRLAPRELARWLGEKRNFVLLDTRNRFEYRLGSFEGAEMAPIDQFVDFAAAARSFPAEWKSRPVVTFCTGGIRCEKAAPYLASLGFQEVYQLEDGILGYFEQVGGAFWRGECFVFDERVGLSPDLRPTGARLCGHCQEPVPLARQGDSCPHCGAEPAGRGARTLTAGPAAEPAGRGARTLTAGPAAEPAGRGARTRIAGPA